MAQAYEPGMKIAYDAATKRVSVAFRGRMTILPESYESEAEAIAAGERFCHQQGWQPKDGSIHMRKDRLRRPW